MIKFKLYLRNKVELVKQTLPFLICLPAGLFFALAGCTSSAITKPDPTLMDTSILTDKPCKPPCWQGLILNESSSEQVYAKLDELPFVEHDSLKSLDFIELFGLSEPTMIYYNCKAAPYELCGSLAIADDVLKVSTHRLQYYLPLYSVVNKLGEPNIVFYSPTPHGNSCVVDLEWPEKNILVSIEKSYRTKLCQEIQAGEAFEPDIDVFEVYYLVQDAFNKDRCHEYNCVPWPGLKEK